MSHSQSAHRSGASKVHRLGAETLLACLLVSARASSVEVRYVMEAAWLCRLAWLADQP